ncbi:MAG: acetate--CoA ligase family protein, partial [Propionivibrio sp.]
MKIHEYQGKELLRKYGVTVPRGEYCQTVDDAVQAAQRLGGKVWVVKAQIHAGGRGKGGGVKVAKSLDDVRQYASQILGMQLVTHQTGPHGQKVRRLLVEEGADIKKEYYVAALTDRASQKVVMMASSEGGMEIEEVAHATPEKILKAFVDPLVGLTDAQAAELATGIGIPDASVPQAVTLLKGLYTCYMETDASLAEINPLIL